MPFGILGKLTSTVVFRLPSDCGRLFVLDDHKLANVPGTGLLSDKTSNQLTIEEARGLKRGAGKNSHIVLIPQPSDDPRDPYVTYIGPYLCLIISIPVLAA